MSWSGTVSGRRLDYLNPRQEDIDIEDIAIGLSHTCRFSGQIERFYSVGSHSIAVARTVWDETSDPIKALQGLLHDASEAYTGDCPSPLKRDIAESWKSMERNIQRTIYDKYQLPRDKCAEVVEADARWLVTERDHLQPRGASWEHTKWADTEPYPTYLHYQEPPEVRHHFMYWFYFLCNKQQFKQEATPCLS